MTLIRHSPVHTRGGYRTSPWTPPDNPGSEKFIRLTTQETELHSAPASLTDIATTCWARSEGWCPAQSARSWNPVLINRHGAHAPESRPCSGPDGISVPSTAHARCKIPAATSKVRTPTFPRRCRHVVEVAALGLPAAQTCPRSHDSDPRSSGVHSPFGPKQPSWSKSPQRESENLPDVHGDSTQGVRRTPGNSGIHKTCKLGLVPLWMTSTTESHRQRASATRASCSSDRA